MQGCQSCCFHHSAVALPFSCSSAWSAPPQARRGNSFLNAVSVPEISSGIHHLPCFGRLSCCTTPLSAFAALLVFVHWEFGTESLTPCPTPILHGRFSVLPPPLLLVLKYSLLLMFFSFAGGIIQSAQGLCWIIFSGEMDRFVTCGTWLLPVCSAVSYKQLWSCLAGRKASFFFFSAAWHREVFHGLGVQDVTEFDSDWCSISACWEKEKNK
jgi:hypothetical protein